jgi:hypothetical protein
MAGSDDIRAHLRHVEDNEIPHPGGNPGDLRNLIEDVDKIRYIIIYYNDLTKPNDVKDSDLLKKREAIKYESTGKTNLTKDVTSYFQQIINIELEMQDHVKLSSYLKIQMCSRTLTRDIPSLASPISSLPLTTAVYTFDNFRTDVLKLCNQLHVTEAHHHFDSYGSSNSSMLVTSPQANSTRTVNMTEKQLRQVLTQARRNGQQGNSNRYKNEYGKRDRSRERSRSPHSSSSSSSSSTPKNRDDNRGRGRSSSNDRGRNINNRAGQRGISFSSNSTILSESEERDGEEEDISQLLDVSFNSWISESK